MAAFSRLVLFTAALLSAQNVPHDRASPKWESGKIIRAEQPKRRTPEPYEVWNPSLTHWYTIETASEIIRATEMVHAGVKRQGSGVDTDRDPPMAFRTGEVVRLSLQTPPRDPKKHREIHVFDSKGVKHVLTVDGIASKPGA